MWHLETRFSGGFGSVGLIVGLNLRGNFQSSTMYNYILIPRVQINAPESCLNFLF